jgi:hypothetical protein
MWLVRGICYKIRKLGRWLDPLSCVLDAVGTHPKLLILLRECTWSGMSMTGDSEVLRNGQALRLWLKITITKLVSVNPQVHS